MSKRLSTNSGLTQFGNILMRVCIIFSMVLSNMAIQTTPVSADSGKSTRVEKVDLENVWDKPLSWLEDVGDKIGALSGELFNRKTTEVTSLAGSDVAENIVGADRNKRTILNDSSKGSQANFAFDEIYGFTAAYFNNRNLTPPAFAIQDGETIDYDWGGGAPITGMPGDQYSIRWYGKLVNNEIIEAEEFTFTSLSDDGVRLWIDGNLIIDAWFIQGPTEYSGVFTLEPGIAYDFVFEYFEEGGGAAVQLELESLSTSRRMVTSTDFQKIELENIQTNFDFSKGSALANGLDTVTVSLTVNDENNLPISDDLYVKIKGSGVYIDGESINTLDWIKIEESDTTGVYQFDIKSSEPEIISIEVKIGNFPLNSITNYEFTLADPNSGLSGEYYSNMYLEEPSFLTLENQKIDFEWGSYSPFDGMPGDNFSVRWTGYIEANYSELYTLHTFSDDGIRLWINGVQIIDSWNDNGSGYHSGQYTMAAGEKYGVIVEYQEIGGLAAARLEWESVSLPREIITRNNLSMPGAEDYIFDVDFSKIEVVGDGEDSSQITVTLTDSEGNPIYDEDVYIKVSGEDNTFNGYEIDETDWMPLLPVGETGQYIGDLKSITEEIKSIQFMVGVNIIENVYSVEFTEDPSGNRGCVETSDTNGEGVVETSLFVPSGQICEIEGEEITYADINVEGILNLIPDVLNPNIDLYVDVINIESAGAIRTTNTSGVTAYYISQELTVNGELSANGGDGEKGGTLQIEAEQLGGSGKIQANGGSGNSVGEGGYIILDIQDNQYTGGVEAYGGELGYYIGKPGVIHYLQEGRLIINNDGNFGYYTFTEGEYSFDRIELGNGIRVVFKGEETIINISDGIYSFGGETYINTPLLLIEGVVPAFEDVIIDGVIVNYDAGEIGSQCVIEDDGDETYIFVDDGQTCWLPSDEYAFDSLYVYGILYLLTDESDQIFDFNVSYISIGSGAKIRVTENSGHILFTTDDLSLNGILSSGSRAGGDGGEIIINTDYIHGSGEIKANGDQAVVLGDGGKISFDAMSNYYSGKIQAFSGINGDQVGTPGTIYYVNIGRLVINNADLGGIITFAQGEYTYDRIELGNAIEVIFEGTGTVLTINDGLYGTGDTTPIVNLEGNLISSDELIVDHVILNWSGKIDFEYNVNISKSEVFRDGYNTSEITLTLADDEGNPISRDDVFILISGNGNELDGVSIATDEWILFEESETLGTYVAGISSSVVGVKDIEFLVGETVLSNDYWVEFIELNSGSGLIGEYYDNDLFEGSPCAVVYGEVVDFEVGENWPNINPSECSSVEAIRWKGRLSLYSSMTYEFSSSNDELKIWVDGKEVSGDSPTINFATGYYPLQVEISGLSELTSDVVDLNWSRNGTEPVVMPSWSLSYINAGQSTIGLSNDTIIADGEQTTDVTIQAKRDDGRILLLSSYIEVYIKMDGPRNYLNGTLMPEDTWVSLGPLNSEGQATGQITTTSSGTKVIQATIRGMLIPDTVTFEATQPDVYAFQVLLDGETADPESQGGKTGEIVPLYRNDPVHVELRAVNESYGLLEGVNGTAILSVANENANHDATINIEDGIGDAYIIWPDMGEQGFSFTGEGVLGDISVNETVSITDTMVVADGETVYTDEVRTYLTSDVTISDSSIVVADTTGFYPGHRILLLKMTGDDTGEHEILNISNINGDQLILETSLTLSYPRAAGITQVIVIPRIEQITIQSGGELTTNGWDGTTGGVLYLDVNEINVESGGVVHSDATGYKQGGGPGAGTKYTAGGYGGEGASDSRLVTDGKPYGTHLEPIQLGSGGGAYCSDGCDIYTEKRVYGGTGGGIVRISANSIINNGTLSANGGIGGSVGSGSGGSLWITTTELLGSGLIQTIGGRGSTWGYVGHTGYGGGGGRIAIETDINQYTGSVQAFGGEEGYIQVGNFAGAGSIYWANENKLVIDNNNREFSYWRSGLVSGDYNFDSIELVRDGSLMLYGEETNFDIGSGNIIGDGTGALASEGNLAVNGPLTLSTYSLDVQGTISGTTSLFIGNGQTVEMYAETPLHSGAYTIGNITIASGATLLLHNIDDEDEDYEDDIPVELVANNITVQDGGIINLDGEGYEITTDIGNGPGGGLASSESIYAVGGSHGGKAGENPDGMASAETYGNIETPVTMGSAGGTDDPFNEGGNGGGALHLIVNNLLDISGKISADGEAVEFSTYVNRKATGGGGAGGSLWIEAGEIDGDGSITAKGGDGDDSSGGGGGRLSILAQTIDPNIKLNVDGGMGINAGEHGTIYLGTLDSINSTVVANPLEVAVGGVAASTVTATLMAQNGHVMPYKDITVTLVNGSSVLINGNTIALNESVTLSEANPNGQISFAASALTVGPRDLKISVDRADLTQHAIINFDAGDFNPDLSTIISTPVNVPADGVSQGTITVTALDINSLPIMNVSIGLSASGDAVVTQPIGKTDASGQAIGYVSNAKVESVTVTGNAWGSPLNQTATVNFYGTDFAPSLQVPQRAVPGDEVSIAVTLRNNQAYLVEDVTLSLTLPEMLTFDSHTASTAPVINGQVYTWTIDTLAANQVVKFNVNGTISSTVTMGESLPISVTASSAVTEINPANNTAQASIAIVQGYSFDASITPVTQTLYPGGVVVYAINIANTDLLPDLYSLDITGLDAFTTTLSSDELAIDAGGTNKATLTVATNSCMAESSINFTVRVTSTQSGIVEDIPVTLALNMSPKITLTTPKNNSTSGSRSVLFSWQTDPSTTGKLTIYPTNDPTATQVYTTVEGTTHSVQVENLVRNTTYSWFVESTSACGSGTSPVRNLTIGNGIVFTNHSQNITINRDYDQRVTVTVKNEDSLAHTLTSNVTNTYEDLIVNFVDSGSVDETITLEPGQTANLTLAIHTQDATQSDYTLTANLTADEGGTPITDSAVLKVHVLFAGDYSIVEDLAAYNPITLARTYVITNHGQTITDLSLEAIDPNTGLPASIYLSPSLDHARLATGESIRVVAYPIFTAEDAQAQEIVYSPTFHVAKTLMVEKAEISYFLNAIGGGNTVTISGNISCSDDKQIYLVTLHDCNMTFKTNDWYCTNRPVINTPIKVPAFISLDSIAKISLQMEFSPQSGARPHNGEIYFNNTEIMSFTNQLPTGTYKFPVPTELWNQSMAGMVTQNMRLVSHHPNGGHYISVTGYAVNVQVDNAMTYACANSQAEAEAASKQTYVCDATASINLETDVFDNSVLNLAEVKSFLKSTIQENNIPISVSVCTQGDCADPIDSRTGVFSMNTPDLSIPTSAGNLVFQRSYSTGSIELYKGGLGYGWTYNHAASLIFPDDVNGMEDYVLFKDHLGNQHLFKIEDDGSYNPGPGVLASLTASGDIYTVLAGDGTTFTFNNLGMITSLTDAQGNAFSYSYNEEGLLSSVSADEDTRYLDFTYNAQGRIVSVSDHTDREVTFTYDAKNDLVASTDLLDQEWTYTYDANHRMTGLLDPSGAQSIKTEYDMLGRAYRQYDGDGNMLVKIIYHDDGSVTMVDANGKSETHSYDSRGIMISGKDQVARDTDTVYDANFRPTSITNEIGSTLDMEWSADGKYLLAEEDPAGNRTTYTYDTLGNLTSTTDASGNTKSYTYTGKLLASSTDAEGKTTSYTYTPEGWLESQTDAYGRTTSYTYDDHGQRLTTTDWLGESTGYTYDELGNQTETVDAQGRINRNEYDDAGQLLRSIRNYDPARPQNDGNLYNLITSYTYDMFGNQETVTDTLGHTTRYEYDSSGHLVRTIDAAVNTTSNTYDGKGQLVSSTDARGNKTTYVYDAAGRRLSTVNALGISSGTTTFNLTNNTSTASDSAGNAAVYTYNELNQVVKIVDPMGHETITTYNPDGSVATKTDELGRITTYEYDDLNRLVKTTDGSGAVTQSVYDAEGNRVASIDALGNQTTYTYDDMGRVISTTDALDHQTSSVYDDDGKLVSSTDTMGRATHYEYDEWGRKSAMTDGAGRRTTYTYDVLDRVISTTGPMGTRSTTYDALGRVVSTTDENGRTATTTYDVLGRVKTSTDTNGNTTTNTYDAAGNLIASRVNDEEATRYTYDKLNRRITVTDPLGNTSRTVYDSLGNVSEEINAKGVVTHYIYDSLQRNTAVIQNYKAGVAASADTNVRVDYTYNAVGNRIYVNDANGHVTEFQYDAANRVTQKIDPLGNTWTYTYDLAGNLISRTDGNSAVTGFGYDDGGNLLNIDYPEGEADVSFTYDASGQRETMTDGLGTTTWHYDTQGRLESVTDAYNSVLTYSYDDEGNRIGLTYPDGKQVNYTYDLDHHLAEVAAWDTQSSVYEYDALGQLISLLRPNGVTSTYAYDELGRLTGLEHASEVSSLANYSYTYDEVGNIIHAEENVSGGGASGPTVGVTVVDTTGQALAGISVYAFKDGTYTNYSKVTDDKGQLSITLPEGTYRFRADIPPAGGQGRATEYWSGESDHCEIGNCGQVTMTIPEAVTVSVMDTNNNVLPGITVYAFNGTTYSSYSAVSDENGQVSMRLPVGAYRFRADFTPSGGTGGTTEFWSGTENTCSVPGCTVDDILVTLPLIISVKNDLGEPMAGLNVYAFNGTTYTNKTAVTNAAGEVQFSLPEGNYRFRADLSGTQFWSGSENHCTLPGCSAALITVSLPVTLTVVDTGGDLIPNVNVYAFKGTTYTGFSKKTDANGEAVFTLPAGDYRFRADFNTTQFWSGTNTTCAIPGCTTDGVTVSKPLTVTVLNTAGTAQAGLPVYAFNGTTYTGFSKTTGSNGEVQFTLPLGAYRFRADLNGTQFWSATANDCTLPGCEDAQVTVSIPVQVNVLGSSGEALSGIAVYAFNGTTYTNFSKTTSASGVATFTLPLGEYRFRADIASQQIYSNLVNHCTLPGCETVTIQVGGVPTATATTAPTLESTATATLEATQTPTETLEPATAVPSETPVETLIPSLTPTLDGMGWLSQPVTHLGKLALPPQQQSAGVSVLVSNTEGTPQAGLNVYAFNGETYSGINGITDEAGSVTLNLSAGEYRFRADLNPAGGAGGTQFWSAETNTCTVPACTSASITVTKPLTVTVLNTDGTPQADLPVYAFNGETYMNISGTTDANGQVIFILPIGDYRFRSDLGGTYFWSNSANHCTLPGCESALVYVSKPLTVTVLDSNSAVMAGLNVYAFNGETYTGYSKVSDENGLAIFNLPLGDYRFRADSGGTQFWSAATNTCTLPGCESAVVTVTPPVTLTVVDTDGLAQAGLNVYAFNGTTYTGFSKVTDAAGQAVFILPAGEYRFRADVPPSAGAGGAGTQFWSAETNTCTLPGCTTAAVTVTKPIKVTVAGEAENPYVGLTVYAFDDSTYSGYSAVTDAGGKVSFTLPLGEYRFRADYDGVPFWSGTENTCVLPTCAADTVTLPGGTGMQEVSIDYTYDALNRLTSATYSNGTKFAYTYDAAGNVLTYAATHYGLTTTTTYTYDEANQLLSAVDSSTAWQYTYDGNGSLLQSDPGTGAANGSTGYTYNTAGYLVKLETHNGTDWQTQSEMKYDGLGNRLEMTTYSDGVGNTTRYVLDSGATLTAIGTESSTLYLYGRGVMGTFSESWSYILQDGAGSTRQLVDTEGAVQLSISYTPWGDTLELYGSGMLNLGYMGGVYDAGTGLIYMGNGQYYDPSTGRFLTRGANADQSNPYTPWNTDPSGMLIAPLALLALVFGRKKNRTKLDHFVILLVIGLSVGLSVSAFAWAPTTYFDSPLPGGTQPPTSTPPAIPAPISTNLSLTYENDSPDQPIWTPSKKPLRPDCNGNMVEYDLVDIDNLEKNGNGQFYGTEPDKRGVLIATYYKELIEFYAKQSTYVTPIMVALGIVIQSNWSGNFVDIGQSADNPDNAFGIGGFSQKQIIEHFKDPSMSFEQVQYISENESDPNNPRIAIRAMVKRIERVLKNSLVTDFKPTETDKLILAILAQQNNKYDVGDILNMDIYKSGGDNVTKINWKRYFTDLSKDKEIKILENPTVTNAKIRSGSIDYNTQFMLQLAVLDLRYMQEFGWDIPSRDIIGRMEDLAYYRGGN